MEVVIDPPPRGENRGKKLAILAGGGPAPGINGVIRSVTLEALRRGIEVVGILEGFKWLGQGDATHAVPLDAERVAAIHLQGGSILRTARDNPTRDPEKLANVVRALRALEVDYLVTIGGDDTSSSAGRVDAVTGAEIRVAHVPKTIDNDLPLPEGIPTFGYETARQVGTGIVTTLAEDARTTGRWYFVVAMGRTAGHLALGIGRAAGAPLTIIPEEFRGEAIPLDRLVAMLEGAMLKRLARGVNHGVAVIAEGTAECVRTEDLADIENVERDAHGHVRLAELPFGDILKRRVRAAFAERGQKVTIVSKNLGYELRCAPPVAYDMAYTQDLGAAAVRFLVDGGSGAIMCVHGGRSTPLTMKDLQDPATGRTRVRRVDPDGDLFRTSVGYMDRITADDLGGERLEALARAAGVEPLAIRARFASLAG